MYTPPAADTADTHTNSAPLAGLAASASPSVLSGTACFHTKLCRPVPRQVRQATNVCRNSGTLQEDGPKFRSDIKLMHTTGLGKMNASGTAKYILCREMLVYQFHRRRRRPTAIHSPKIASNPCFSLHTSHECLNSLKSNICETVVRGGGRVLSTLNLKVSFPPSDTAQDSRHGTGITADSNNTGAETGIRPSYVPILTNLCPLSFLSL